MLSGSQEPLQGIEMSIKRDSNAVRQFRQRGRASLQDTRKQVNCANVITGSDASERNLCLQI